MMPFFRPPLTSLRHCLSTGKTITVGLGSDNKEEGRRVTVSKSIIHPSYDEITDQYDVGLVILDTASSLSFPLPTLNNNNLYPVVGSEAHVMGWGDTDDADDRKVVSDDLMIVDLEVISNERCESANGGDTSYEGWIYDDMICTYTRGHDACQGDSGECDTRGIALF